MRTIAWLGGVGVVLVAAVIWGMQHPGSLVDRGLSWCCPMHGARHSACATRGCPALIVEVPTLEEIPEEPTPVEEPVAIAAAPPTIVIIEEDPSAPSASEVVELAIFKGPTAPADIAAAPVSMPYCEDDLPRMPYVAEFEETETSGLVEVEPRDSEVEKVTAPVPFSAGEPSLPRCEVESDYHQHYSGCPHYGHCTRGSVECAVPPYREPPKQMGNEEPYKSPAKPMGGGEETSEEQETNEPPPQIQKHETMKPSETLRILPTAESDLDTMEYRQSDGHLGDFGPGPV